MPVGNATHEIAVAAIALYASTEVGLRATEVLPVVREEAGRRQGQLITADMILEMTDAVLHELGARDS